MLLFDFPNSNNTILLGRESNSFHIKVLLYIGWRSEDAMMESWTRLSLLLGCSFFVVYLLLFLFKLDILLFLSPFGFYLLFVGRGLRWSRGSYWILLFTVVFWLKNCVVGCWSSIFLKYCGRPKLRSIITGYLPSAILNGCIYIVPFAMIGLARLAGYISRSKKDINACNMVFYFLVGNVFFLSLLSGSLLDQIGESFFHPKDIPNRLASAVSAQVQNMLALLFSFNMYFAPVLGYWIFD